MESPSHMGPSLPSLSSTLSSSAVGLASSTVELPLLPGVPPRKADSGMRGNYGRRRSSACDATHITLSQHLAHTHTHSCTLNCAHC